MIARTRPLDTDVDLLAFAGGDGVLFSRGGVGLAGWGVAARLDVAEATKWLADVDVDDEVRVPGTGPVAFGSLPFAGTDTGMLIVPEVVVGRAADGTRWVTTIDDAAVPDVPTRLSAPPTLGGAFAVRPSIPPEEWQDAVASARDLIRAGRLQKVVLAREIVVEADRPIDRLALLARLRATFGSSYLYAIDGHLGASPELLVARSGDMVRSHPLAGTTARTGDPDTDARLAAALIASTKDQLEHRLTIDMVHDTLLPWCSYLDEEAEPSIVAVANVQHLGTRVEGRLSRPVPSVLDLVLALHPTPAVGGWPRADALAVMGELERLDRGRYAGPVGWVDAAGNGTWAVGIRGATVDGATARVVAGVGVVADSDPDAELAETQAKFQAILGALIRP